MYDHRVKMGGAQATADKRTRGAEANDANGGRSTTSDRRRLLGKVPQKGHRTFLDSVLATGVWALSSAAVVLESRRQER